jgi:hypothetical protein
MDLRYPTGRKSERGGTSVPLADAQGRDRPGRRNQSSAAHSRMLIVLLPHGITLEQVQYPG